MQGVDMSLGLVGQVMALMGFSRDELRARPIEDMNSGLMPGEWDERRCVW
jgi:hypothetical protein